MKVFDVLRKIDQFEYSDVIKHPHLKWISPAKDNADLRGILGDESPSHATVKLWLSEPKHGKEGVKDEPRPGRSLTVTSPDQMILSLM